MNKLFSGLILLVLVSCNTTSYRSRVKSQTVNTITNKSYHVTPLYKGVNKGDIEFVQYSQMLKSVLNKRGMKNVESGSDIAVMLGYGNKGRSYVYTYTTYDTSTVDTTTTSYYTGNTYTSTSTIRTPKTNVVTGYTYDQHVIVKFIDFKHYLKTKEIKELSKLVITSTRNTTNLKDVLEVIIRSALPYIGTNRVADVQVVWDNDKKKITEVSGDYLSDDQEKEIMDFINEELMDFT